MKDIDLQIRESSISGYTVSLRSGREKLAEVFLRHSQEIRRLPAALETCLRDGVGEDDFLALARKLHGQVFQEPIARAFQELREAGPVRLRIRAEPPEIARIPWEALLEGDQPLSLLPGVAFSRLPLDAPAFKPPAGDPDLSILCAAAEPEGAKELEALEEALEELGREGLVRLTRLRSASLDSIRSALATGQFRGVAIAAAGPVGSDRATGYLRLVGDGARVREHNLTELAPLLYGHRGIRFLLLSAGCAHPDWSGESFEGLVRLCFGMKISAALALPSPLPRTPYVQFLRTFFTGAVRGDPLDHAAGEARRAIREEGGIEFAVPVVYAADPFCLKVGEGQVLQDPMAGFVTESIVRPASGIPREPFAGAMGVSGVEPTPGKDPVEEFQPESPPPPPLDPADLDEESLEEEDELHEEVERFAAEGDRLNEAAALDRLGRCQARRGRTRKAIVSYQHALDILKEEGEADSVLAVLLHLARVFEQAREPGRARKTYEEHLALSGAQGNQRMTATALGRLGELRRCQGDLDASLEAWMRAVAIWQEVQEEGRAADLLTRVGAVFQEKGEYGEAESAYQGSLEIHRRRDDPVGMATSLNNLGNVALRQMGRDEAVARYSEALDFFRKAESREGIASVSHNLANIALGLGDHQKSFDLSKEARSISEELGLASLLASCERLLQKLRATVGDEAFRRLG